MDADTERALIARAKAGETAAVDELMRAGEGLIKRTARRGLLPGLELEECEQVARLAYWQSIGRFDRRRKGRLSSFAMHRMRGAIVDLHRERTGLIRVPRLAVERGEPRPRIMHLGNVVRHNDLGEAVEMLVPVAPRETNLDREETKELVFRFLRLACWSQRERLVVLLRAEGLRMRAIAEQLGISESRVSQLLSDIERRSGIRLHERKGDPKTEPNDEAA